MKYDIIEVFIAACAVASYNVHTLQSWSSLWFVFNMFGVSTFLSSHSLIYCTMRTLQLLVSISWAHLCRQIALKLLHQNTAL